MSSENLGNDIPALVTRMLAGAGESVALLVRYLDGREFGMNLEDVSSMVDSRMRLQCMLRLPGISQDRNGLLPTEPGTDALLAQRYEIRDVLDMLESAGWSTRLSASGPTISILLVDDRTALHYSYLNQPPGPYLAEGSSVQHYRDQFDNYWKTAYDAATFEELYDRTLALASPPDASRIALESSRSWTSVIAELARNPRLMYDLTPRQFEELVAELLSRDGMDVQLTPETRDGGRDILAFHRTPVGRLLYLVECKRFQPGRPVGVAIVQRLYGVVAGERATAGLVATTSRFTRDAIKLAESVRHQMGLKDYQSIKAWLKEHSGD